MDREIKVSASLLEQAIKLLDEREWETHNAAENVYCSSCTQAGDRWEDQSGHYAGCAFVATRDALRKALEDRS